MARWEFKSSKHKTARMRLPDKENESPPQVVIQVDATKEEAETEEVTTPEPARATRKTATNVTGALRAHAKLQRAQAKPACWVDDDDDEGHCLFGCPIS